MRQWRVINFMCSLKRMNKTNIIAEEFVYYDQDRNQKYVSYQLRFGDVQLVVAASMVGGPHPDFLATLRNLVGVEKGYENKSILFIHCSSLDSILGGAGSLCKEGMPLNISVIETDIQRKINETGYSETDKAILSFYLENKSRELQGTTSSIFEYKDIICSLNDSQITVDEYRRFELFPDEALHALSGKKLKERIAENHFNYVRVAEIHSYGLDADRLEKYYGEDGAKALMKPEWEEISFSDIEKYIDSKKNIPEMEYIPIMSHFLIWDKEEGASKAKSRTRNIIMFITSEETINLTLTFTEFTKKTGIDIPKPYKPVLKCEASGKRLNVELSEIEDKAAFYRLKYNSDGTKFDFKIAVLRCDPALIENIKTQYSIEMRGGISAIRINTDEDEVIFNEYASSASEEKITEENQVVSVRCDERLTVIVGEDYPYSEDNEDVVFSLSTEKFVIPMIKAFAIEKPTVIEGMKLWYLKRVKRNNFEIMGDNNLVFGTKKYFARDEFRKSLELEKKYIKLGCPFAVEKAELNGQLEEVTMKLTPSISDTFNRMLAYFKDKNTIPSLVYVDETIARLYLDYLKAIVETINAIPEGGYLSEEERNIFYLGMIKRQYGDFEVLLTPLHPINITYQLFINSQNIDGLEDGDMDLLRKFQHTSLLPYINIDPYTTEKKLYIPIEQNHSPEWKIYVEDTLPRYKGSKDFVSKLVAEKIQEFVEHFSYLFSKGTSAPIRINLINTGDCREIVQGIIKYYVRELNSEKNKCVIPIRVTMYSDTKMDNTAFELMSQINNAEILMQSLGIEVRVEDMDIDEIIDIYRRNVHFYYKDINDDFEYAHITFLEMDDDNQAVNTLMNDIPSGIVMNGISSGVPSERLGDSYRTGFGTKYVDSKSQLVDIAVKMNAINAAINGEAYRSDACYAIKMSVNNQRALDRIYEASNWVTFINPKVDLTYFKSDLNAKDLLIIHYSDQYNMTSSGYDAITVTKKSKQYQYAISRYLTANGVVDAESHSKHIINMFNAMNGDWLLRMLSYKSHFPVEKLSILSAMKVAVKRYAVSGVIWIPVSLEEILRVSGSVGLAQNKSIFSAKNLGFDGATSDDLLLIGVRQGERVQVTFYPIEVKIGKVESDYLAKGIKQALKTRQIFDEILGGGLCVDKPIKTRLYRNFFMQQAMVNAGKMLLYEVGDGTQGWEQITQSDLRRKLLEEDYEIVESLIPEMGKAGVFSFREECLHEREVRNQGVLIVEKAWKEGVNLLAKPFSEIESVEWDLVEETLDLTTLYNDNAEGQEHTDDIEIIEEVGDNDRNESSKEQMIENTGRVLIGKDLYMHNVYWEFGSTALANRHLLVTGTSGQGKTYSIQTMLQ